MNDEQNIRTEEVDHIDTPPRARVSDVTDESTGGGTGLPEPVARKRDYLEGFLKQAPAGDSPVEPGGDTYEAIIEALKEIYDPEIPVNIYDLGLIYGVDVTAGRPCRDHHDADHAALPGCRVHARRSRDARRRGAGRWPCRGQSGLGSALGPAEMTDEAKLELGML